MVRDLSPEKLAVGQSRDCAHERFRRQLAQPQRNAGGSRRLGEAAAVDHARDRACGIAPSLRNGQCEEQRGKARSKIRKARMPRGQGAHCSLDAWMISPKPALAQVSASGHLTRGRQEIGCHDKRVRNRGTVRPRQVRCDVGMCDLTRESVPGGASNIARRTREACSRGHGRLQTKNCAHPIAWHWRRCNPRLRRCGAAPHSRATGCMLHRHPRRWSFPPKSASCATGRCALRPVLRLRSCGVFGGFGNSFSE